MGNQVPMSKKKSKRSSSSIPALYKHAYKQEYQRLLRLLQKTPSTSRVLTHQSQYQNTILHILCGWGCNTPLECILALVLLSPDSVRIKNKGGYTPLHIGLWWGLAEGGVDLLLCAGCTIVNNNSKKKRRQTDNSILSMCDSYGRTPLHMACVSPHPHSIRVYQTLLERDLSMGGARVLMADREGRTPLILFCKRHATELALLLQQDIEKCNPTTMEVWDKLSLLVMAAYYARDVPSSQKAVRHAPFLNLDRPLWKILHASMALYANYQCDEIVPRLALKFHSQQIQQKDSFGDLPLHALLKKWTSSSSSTQEEGKREELVHVLLKLYPKGVQIKNSNGDLPLACAVRSHALAAASSGNINETNKIRTTIHSILKLNPSAVGTMPEISDLYYPFLLSKLVNQKKLDVVFEILKERPNLVMSCEEKCSGALLYI